MAPDPMALHPVAGQQRVVFLKPLVSNPNIEVGDYSYYDDPDDPLAFERNAVLYAFGPERLIIGRYCAIASGVRFLLPGANHADRGPSTFPFGIFGPPWAERTMDLVTSAQSRGDTVIGNDVWIGYQALVLPGGDGRSRCRCRCGKRGCCRCRSVYGGGGKPGTFGTATL